MVVALDGPAGSGKSTVAARVAAHLGAVHLNTGLFYRAITWKALQGGDQSCQALLELARSTTFELDSQGRLLIDSHQPWPELRQDAVDGAVSGVSAVPELRAALNERIRALAASRDLVVEGRDMTTVVFADSPHRFYIDASPEARARRRAGDGSLSKDYDGIQAAIRERDQKDSSRQVGSLTRGEGVHYIDTSDLTIDEVCDKVYKSIQGNSATTIRSNRTAMTMKAKTNHDHPLSVQEELQEAYLKPLDELEEGQLVEGTVVAVTNDQVFIDVGYKSEGKVPRDEFVEVPKVGDRVQVVLINKEGRHGEIIVSKRKADDKASWLTLKTAFTDKKAVPGKVIKVVKGGFEVLLCGVTRAFNPISKIDLFRVEEPEQYIGMETQFYIERLFSDNRVNVIVSRRAWLEEEVSAKKAEFFANKKEGDEVEGTVKSFTSFGSFVDLGGFDGLLHINDMSWGHVTRPKDYVKKGEVLKLVISRIDRENQKINLSLKSLQSNPWDSFNDRYQLDDVVKGKVTKLTDFGAFVEIEPGIEGLVHISELSWTKRVKHPKEVVKVGDDIEAKILGFDLESRKISLGVKQVLNNPWDQINTTYPVGTKLKRVVRKITQTGAFVELEEGIDGYLHVDDVSWTRKPKAMSQVLTEGQEVEVIILQSDNEHHNIRVGMKQLESDPWALLSEQYPEGSSITGTITNITDFGMFVKVVGDIEGLVPKSQLADSRYVDLDAEIKKFNVGDSIKASVLEIQTGKQKLTLSLRELQRQMERSDIAKYMQDEETTEGGATLGDFFKKED